MLIIFEGLDKSGKSALVDIVHGQLEHSVLIRKSYIDCLYPIDWGNASVYDWQTIFDRLIFANPDITFIADRSFFTQTVYQLCLGKGAHAITDEQQRAFNAYCEALKRLPHLVVYCQSARYELDNMVTNISIKNALNDLFLHTLEKSGVNYVLCNVDKQPLNETITNIAKALLTSDRTITK